MLIRSTVDRLHRGAEMTGEPRLPWQVIRPLTGWLHCDPVEGSILVG
jgi:hypothetical protein